MQLYLYFQVDFVKCPKVVFTPHSHLILCVIYKNMLENERVLYDAQHIRYNYISLVRNATYFVIERGIAIYEQISMRTKSANKTGKTRR